ncbi:MAG: hypothetical protein IIC01_08550, partial [Planctomycetes bacterium]|nr:hypothetical protein [Planctomycetota bacterium]
MAIVGRTTIIRDGVEVPAQMRLRVSMLLRNRSSGNGIVRRRQVRPGPGLLLGWLVLSLVGCGAFNPSFLALLDPTGTAGFQSIDNAPGHVMPAATAVWKGNRLTTPIAGGVSVEARR